VTTTTGVPLDEPGASEALSSPPHAVATSATAMQIGARP
jgi:hypothetical protein